jgi:hypothetical protein
MALRSPFIAVFKLEDLPSLVPLSLPQPLVGLRIGETKYLAQACACRQ